MSASFFDSSLYAGLFPTGEARRLFTDSAVIRAMLLVEGALAQAQGKLAVIPELSAAAIHRASLEVQIDPASLAASTAQNGVPVPGLVAAFRAEMSAPEHSQYIHWGATSQDIIDTGLMLRLRQILVLFEHDIRTVLSNLGVLASTHAELPMAARTWGQQATPTSFGAVAASWGIPLLGLLDELPNLRRTSLLVSLSGAAGTSAALGPTAAKQRATLAASLGLNDPQRSWHTDRTPILALTGWMNRCVVALAKMAEDVLSLTQTEIAEVIMKDAGSSSTMPQKQNPVRPSVIAALAVQVSAANGALHTMGIQRHQRDGAAWFAEWAMLPQIVLGTAAALQQAATLTTSLAPDADKMRSNLGIGSGLIHAEALSFALASMMPRPKAQIETKTLCKSALDEGKTLEEVARAAYLNLAPELFDPACQMGLAPTEARAFSARVRALK